MLKNKILLCISIILLLCLILFDGYKIYQNKRLEQSDIVSMHMSDIMEIWYLSNDLCNLLDSNSEQQYRLMLINSTLHRFTRRLGPILQLDNSEDSLRMYQFFDKLCEKINKLEANGDIKRLDEVLEQEFSMNTEKLYELYKSIYDESDNFLKMWEREFGSIYGIGNSLKEYKAGIDLMHNYATNLMKVCNNVME